MYVCIHKVRSLAIVVISCVYVYVHTCVCGCACVGVCAVLRCGCGCGWVFEGACGGCFWMCVLECSLWLFLCEREWVEWVCCETVCVCVCMCMYINTHIHTGEWLGFGLHRMRTIPSLACSDWLDCLDLVGLFDFQQVWATWGNVLCMYACMYTDVRQGRVCMW